MSGAIHPITMPKWGIEMQEGTVTAWHFAPGQAVNKGDALLDVETEKIVNSVEAPVSGVLRRILGEPGDVRAVGALIGVFAGTEVADAEIERFIGGFVAADTSFEPRSAETAPAAATAPVSGEETAGDADSRVSPIARRVAVELGIDVSQVRGTGRNGRVSKQDVEAYAAAQGRAAPAVSVDASPAAATNPSTREKLSPMRATIARRLLESKQQIPHYRLSVSVDAGALAAHRAKLRGNGIEVSLNDFVVRACALALARHPALNARFDGEQVERFRDADICLAVATEAGLITPVLRAANLKTLVEIAAESAAIAARARAGQLTREDIAGGTFTVSNLGMFGVERFDAVINPPQVAILAVGAARDAVVVRSAQPAVGRLMDLTLSCDHRVVDGAVGAAFLATLRELLEDPAQL